MRDCEISTYWQDSAPSGLMGKDRQTLGASPEIAYGGITGCPRSTNVQGRDPLSPLVASTPRIGQHDKLSQGLIIQ